MRETTEYDCCTYILVAFFFYKEFFIRYKAKKKSEIPKKNWKFKSGYLNTVDLDYNNIGCNKTWAIAKKFSGIVFFFFSNQLY